MRIPNAATFRAIAIGTLIVIGIPWGAGPLAAQTVCGERTEIVSKLAQSYAEMPRGAGLAGAQTLIELLVSPSGGWTLLVTYPTQQTCVMAAGENWESVPKTGGPDT